MKQTIYKTLFITALLVTSFFVLSTENTAHATDGCIDIHLPINSTLNNRIEANKSVYQAAEKQTGVPWELIAAVHYRETNNVVYNPGNGQGIYQLYSLNQTQGLYFEPKSTLSKEEFLRQTILAANFLQSKAENSGLATSIITARKLRADETDLNLIKNALLSYNGRAYAYADQAERLGFNREKQHFEGSPYVMNMFDCKRIGMGIIAYDNGSTINVKDYRMGAFTLYAKLKGKDFWNKLHSGTISELIVCDGKKYLAESTTTRKRLLTDRALKGWGFNDKSGYEGSSACNYPSYTLPIDATFRSRKSGKVYFTDKNTAHYLTTAAQARAWGTSKPSETHPMVDSDTILDNLTLSRKQLGTIVTSNTPTAKTHYLIKEGSRHAISGTDSGNLSTLNSIKDTNSPVMTVSDSLLSSYPLKATKITSTFSNGGTKYILAKEMLYPIKKSTNLESAVTAPQQTWSTLPFKDSQQPAIADEFFVGEYYYKIAAGSTSISSRDQAVISNLTTKKRILNSQLLGIVKKSVTFQPKRYLGDKNNIRTIACNGKQYIVERFIRRKRAITQNAIQKLGLTNVHFFINDKGCAYPSYTLKLDTMMRSRKTRSIYGLSGKNKAIRIDTAAERATFKITSAQADRKSVV